MITSQRPFEEFREEFNALMDRLEEARSTSVTPPERCFKSAQKKIKKGDYSFETDQTVSAEKKRSDLILTCFVARPAPPDRALLASLTEPPFRRLRRPV